MAKCHTVDIYQRTCKKVGLLWKEIDVTEKDISDECDDDVQIPCEEEESDHEPLDCRKLMAELECMKKRIQILQLKIKPGKGICADDPCIDYEIELKCSPNAEICALQKGQHKLQQQINELIRCCQVAKDQIEDLRSRLCQKSREILELQKAVCLLETWRNTLEHEFGVCYERFRHLKMVKAEWADVEARIGDQKRCFEQMKQYYVTKTCFMLEKRQFIEELSDMRDMFQELYQLHLSRTNCLSQRIDAVAQTLLK